MDRDHRTELVLDRVLALVVVCMMVAAAVLGLSVIRHGRTLIVMVLIVGGGTLTSIVTDLVRAFRKDR
jgi:hypothetical protein